jgi:hypothetical protein
MDARPALCNHMNVRGGAGNHKAISHFLSATRKHGLLKLFLRFDY